MNGDIIHQIVTLRNALEQRKGELNILERQHEERTKFLTQCKRDKRNIEEAQLIIQHVAQKTQMELMFQISDIVSTALSAVFDNPYEFKVEFVQRRGKTEAELFFVREDEKINPLIESGGGAVDVAAFALRIALWSLSRDESRNTIILDEPFRFLSRELQPRAGEMLRMLSEKLGVQFIIVTHNQDIVDAADKIFTVKIKDGKSTVEC